MHAVIVICIPMTSTTCSRGSDSPVHNALGGALVGHGSNQWEELV